MYMYLDQVLTAGLHADEIQLIVSSPLDLLTRTSQYNPSVQVELAELAETIRTTTNNGWSLCHANCQLRKGRCLPRLDLCSTFFSKVTGEDPNAIRLRGVGGL